MRDTLQAMFDEEPWPFGRPLCLGSELTDMWIRRRNSSPDNVGHRQCSPSRWSPARQSFRMATKGTDKHLRERRAPTPANTGAARTFRDREWSERSHAMPVSGRPAPSQDDQIRRSGQLSGDASEEQRKAVGWRKSEPNRNRQSACKGTREARLSMGTTRLRRVMAEAAPMRQAGGGASVVVRGRESRLHGEGRQDVSFWTTEGFTNREGSR